MQAIDNHRYFGTIGAAALGGIAVKFGRLRRAAICGALGIFVSVTAAEASTLVDQGQNTYDPNTNLLWLDVTVTANHSYNDVAANFIGAGNPYAGYRFATANEVVSLIVNAGVPSGSLTAPPNPNVLPLINLLGDLFGPFSGGNYHGFQGIIGGTNTSGMMADPGQHWYFQFIDNGSESFAGDVFAQNGFNAGSVTVGSFLVADATHVAAAPLPAALPLFATGLGAMGLLGWWRKRRVRQ